MKNFDYLKQISKGIRAGELNLIIASDKTGKTVYREEIVIVVDSRGVARLDYYYRCVSSF